MSHKNGGSDFWWLTEPQAGQVWSVGVAHHYPLADDDQPSLTPPNQQAPAISGWLHSFDDEGNLSPDFRRYYPDVVPKWRAMCENTNVYRTLILWPEESKREPLQGPFLVDIDNQDWTNGYSEDLEDARSVAVLAVERLASRWRLAEGRDFRVFFSGRKGFNIEVRPDPLGIEGSLDQQIRASADCLKTLAELVQPNGGSTVIDRIYGNRFGYRLRHPYIRLHDSWNCWESSGMQTRRRRTPLTTEELVELPVEDIIRLSERT